MTTWSGYAKNSDRWGNALWNLSLLPLAVTGVAAPDAGKEPEGLRKLENPDERRTAASFVGPLSVSQRGVGDTLG